MNYFLIGIVTIFFGFLLTTLFSEKSKAYVFSSFLLLGIIVLSIPCLQSLIYSNIFSMSFSLPEPIGAVRLVLDPLSSFFIMTISTMSLMAVIYSIGYLKPYLNKNKNINFHFFCLCILILSMLTVVSAQNALIFLIIWELMSLSSFFLVIFEDDKKETIAAGINYLIFMHISFLFIALGFILLAIKTGSLDFNSFKIFLESNKIFANFVFLFLFIGFGIKAGFVPFHNWLPKAHPAAPSHVSAIMSSCMIKIGIYGILRVLTLVVTPTLKMAYMVLAISLISSLFGILYALVQKNIKKLLAYSSIENIGIIGVGIGIGMLGIIYKNDTLSFLGFAGSILHVLNHSIFKNLLFLLSGSLYQKTHTKNIERLGGLIKGMPYTATLFLIGALAISALPPFNGFISEFMIYFGMLKGLQIKEFHSLLIFTFSIACLALVGTMSVLCFTKAFSIMFLGNPRSKNSENIKNDVSKIMLAPLFILAFLIPLIGMLPQYAVKIVFNPVKFILGEQLLAVDAVPIKLLTNISFSCLALVLISTVVFFIRKMFLKNRSVYKYRTWACGYEAPSSKMQYTGSSFVNPFFTLTKPFFISVLDLKKPKGFFPKEGSFKYYIKDIFEYYLILPIINSNKKFSKSFNWIQKGDSQTYILYGLVFLILALIGLAIF